MEPISAQRRREIVDAQTLAAYLLLKLRTS